VFIGRQTCCCLAFTVVSALAATDQPNEPRPAGWQILDASISPIAPDGTGQIRSLNPRTTTVAVGTQNFLWIIVQFADANAKSQFTSLHLVSAAGKTQGKARAWIDGGQVQRVSSTRASQMGFEVNPVLAQLKDQAAVAKLKALISGEIVRNKNEVLLIYEGNWQSLDGLSLADEARQVPLRKDAAKSPQQP
jgi:hypothetical protein